MTLTVGFAVMTLWFVASLSAALLFAKFTRQTREPKPAANEAAAGTTPSLKQTA